MRKETIDARFAPPSQTLAEVDKVADGVEVVLVRAAFCRSHVEAREYVGKEDRVSEFLISHEIDERDVIEAHASFSKLVDGEPGNTIVEQIKLDPLLIESEIEGLEVEIGPRSINGGRVIAPDTNAPHGNGCGHRGNLACTKSEGG